MSLRGPSLSTVTCTSTCFMCFHVWGLFFVLFFFFFLEFYVSTQMPVNFNSWQAIGWLKSLDCYQIENRLFCVEAACSILHLSSRVHCALNFCVGACLVLTVCLLSPLFSRACIFPLRDSLLQTFCGHGPAWHLSISFLSPSTHPSPLSWKACPAVGVTIMWSPMNHPMILWVTTLTASHILSVKVTCLYLFPCRIQLSCPTTILSVPHTPLTATASSHTEPSQGGATLPPHLTILR